MNARLIMEEFCGTCEALLTRPGLSPEAAYRIQKIMDRVVPIADNVYLKTIKGGETLQRCTAEAGIVGRHLQAEEDLFYRLLTRLEMTCEDLLEHAYEFRIKAG